MGHMRLSDKHASFNGSVLRVHSGKGAKRIAQKNELVEEIFLEDVKEEIKNE